MSPSDPEKGVTSFPSQYETNVNHHLRNFEPVEEQQAPTNVEEGYQINSKSQLKRRKRIVVILLVLASIIFITTLGVIFGEGAKGRNENGSSAISTTAPAPHTVPSMETAKLATSTSNHVSTSGANESMTSIQLPVRTITATVTEIVTATEDVTGTASRNTSFSALPTTFYTAPISFSAFTSAFGELTSDSIFSTLTADPTTAPLSALNSSATPLTLSISTLRAASSPTPKTQSTHAQSTTSGTSMIKVHRTSASAGRESTQPTHPASSEENLLGGWLGQCGIPGTPCRIRKRVEFVSKA